MTAVGARTSVSLSMGMTPGRVSTTGVQGIVSDSLLQTQ